MEENKIERLYEPFQGFIDRFLMIIDSDHRSICSLPLSQEEFDIIKTWDGF